MLRVCAGTAASVARDADTQSDEHNHDRDRVDVGGTHKEGRREELTNKLRQQRHVGSTVRLNAATRLTIHEVPTCAMRLTVKVGQPQRMRKSETEPETLDMRKQQK